MVTGSFKWLLLCTFWEVWDKLWDGLFQWPHDRWESAHTSVYSWVIIHKRRDLTTLHIDSDDGEKLENEQAACRYVEIKRPTKLSSVGVVFYQFKPFLRIFFTGICRKLLSIIYSVNDCLSSQYFICTVPIHNIICMQIVVFILHKET